MDELIKQVSQATGMSPAIARTAIETVISYLKEALPKPIADQLDAFLSGKGDLSGDLLKNLPGVGDLMGDLFGKKPDK